MTPAALSVGHALEALLFRAKLVPGDSAEAAARKVCDVLERDRFAGDSGDAVSPIGCPLARWLQDATCIGGTPDEADVPYLLVGLNRVIVCNPRRPETGRRTHELVPLPVAVRDAIKLIADRKVRALVKEVA